MTVVLVCHTYDGIVVIPLWCAAVACNELYVCAVDVAYIATHVRYIVKNLASVWRDACPVVWVLVAIRVEHNAFAIAGKNQLKILADRYSGVSGYVHEFLVAALCFGLECDLASSYIVGHDVELHNSAITLKVTLTISDGVTIFADFNIPTCAFCFADGGQCFCVQIIAYESKFFDVG